MDQNHQRTEVRHETTRGTTSADRASKRPIIVLGTDRSGTSMLGEVVFRWGAHAGELEHLGRADEGNPQGYWEYAPMGEFIGELFTSVERTVWEPEFRHLLRQRASEPQWRKRALELTGEMEAAGRPWFWKEPDLGFALPFLKEVLVDPLYLITLRNPCDSALSYEKFFLPPALRDKIRLTGYFLLQWQYFMSYVLEEIKHQNKLFVSYEAVVTSPREQCERIARFLAAHYSPETANDPARIERMAAVIDPGLWRNRVGVSFREAPSASPAQKDLFYYIYNKTRDDAVDLSDFDATNYPFPEFWLEYVSNISVLRWLVQNL